MYQIIETLKRVARRNELILGDISLSHDPVVAKIIQGWPSRIDASRAISLGFPTDSSLDRVIQDYIEDFLPRQTKKAGGRGTM